MFRLLTGFFALPLLAQNAWVLPPPPVESLTPDVKAMRVFRTPHTVTAQTWNTRFPNMKLTQGEPAAKPCAIPLKSVLRFREPDPPMPKFKPLPNRFPMREAPLPAPSCEDKERK